MLVEVTMFGLRDGVAREALLAADHDLQETLNSQRGFVRRTTAEGDSGWAVITLWADAATADAGADVVEAHEFASLIQDVDSRRYTDIGG